jgi:hypothetical protein
MAFSWRRFRVLVLLGCCGALLWLEVRPDGRLPSEDIKNHIQAGMTEVEVERVLGPAESVNQDISGQTTKHWPIREGRVGEPPWRPSVVFLEQSAGCQGLKIYFWQGNVVSWIFKF